RLLERNHHLVSHPFEESHARAERVPGESRTLVLDERLEIDADDLEPESVAAHPALETFGRADRDLVTRGAQRDPQRHERLHVAARAEAGKQDSHGLGFGPGRAKVERET